MPREDADRGSHRRQCNSTTRQFVAALPDYRQSLVQKLGG